jgi:hypothetical protein
MEIRQKQRFHGRGNWCNKQDQRTPGEIAVRGMSRGRYKCFSHQWAEVRKLCMAISAKEKDVERSRPNCRNTTHPQQHSLLSNKTIKPFVTPWCTLY